MAEGVSAYSTCGGLPPWSVRETSPSCSIARSVSVSAFGVMPRMCALSSVNRIDRSARALTTNTVHRAPMRCSTVRLGQVAAMTL